MRDELGVSVDVDLAQRRVPDVHEPVWRSGRNRDDVSGLYFPLFVASNAHSATSLHNNDLIVVVSVQSNLSTRAAQ